MSARAVFVALYAADVRANLGAFDADVQAAPEQTAERLVDDLDEVDIARMTRELKAEIRTIKRITGL